MLIILFAPNYIHYIQWDLSKTATCGPVLRLVDLYSEVAALQRWIAML